jgi:methyl-accepting chemotaxis protein
MAVPWLAVGQLVLNNLDTILGVVRPAFTRKKVETLPNQTELLNQQIAELQAAASSNADQIRQLAAQLKEMVAALEQAASAAQAARQRATRLSVLATAISLASMAAVVYLAISQ